eukprot:13522551-Ditylum_brightwellii.AAC.1
MANKLGLHPTCIMHTLTFNVMHITFHSSNINLMASGISLWHVPHLPAMEGNLPLSLAIMWDSALGLNIHTIMDKWKQVPKIFKVLLP